jgi:hypothetical protein
LLGEPAEKSGLQDVSASNAGAGVGCSDKQQWGAGLWSGTELFSCFTDGITVSLLTSPRVGCDVAYWPYAAVGGCLLFRRCRGISRHSANGAENDANDPTETLAVAWKWF